MSTPVENACPHCEFEVPDNHEICPHCYLLTTPPMNVRRAKDSRERAELQARYDRAIAVTSDRADVVKRFEADVSQSKAVMVLSLTKLMPLVTEHVAIYAAYRDLADLRFSRDSDGLEPAWGENRYIAEIRLLGESAPKDKLHYAALSIDGSGLTSYSEGDVPVTVALREKMIAHRVTVFEMNSGLHVEQGNSKFPPGWRATWDDRGKLGVAKLATRLSKDTQSPEFARILLTRGKSSLEDEFIEVHVFGTMTVHTFEKVFLTLTPPNPKAGLRQRRYRHTTAVSVLKDYCDKADAFFQEHKVPFETR